MNIVINNVDFWDGFAAQKYWSIGKNKSREERNKLIKDCMLGGNYIGARKYDGVWSMIIKDNDGNFHLRSRTENVNGTYADKADWIEPITNELKELPNGTVLLGEIYKANDEGSRKATAILNCLKDKSIARQKETPLNFYCFDCLAFDGYTYLNISLIDRIKVIEDKVKYLVKNPIRVEFAKYYDGEKLWDVCGEVLANGGEGVVIQKKTSVYTCGARKAWESIKVKKEINEYIDAFADGEYKPSTKEYNGSYIESWNLWENTETGEKFNTCKFKEYSNGEPYIPISKGYYNNWASAISFSLMKDGKPKHIAWISGITEDIRDKIVNNPEVIVGQVAELSCMQIEEIEGEYSLRHGKIEQWRKDKTKEDCEFSQVE